MTYFLEPMTSPRWPRCALSTPASGCVFFSRVGPDELREKLRRVLHEEAFRQRAQQLQALMAKAGGAVRGAEIIEQVFQERRPVLRVSPLESCQRTVRVWRAETVTCRNDYPRRMAPPARTSLGNSRNVRRPRLVQAPPWIECRMVLDCGFRTSIRPPPCSGIGYDSMVVGSSHVQPGMIPIT